MPWNLTAVAVVGGLFAVVLGLPVGLYALLTREKRQTMQAIRVAASQRGWRYRPRRCQGNLTAFRIAGQTRGGLSWILTSGSTSGYDLGWSVRLNLRFPALGGETDLAVLPREVAGRGAGLSKSAKPLEAASRVAAVSGAAANTIRLLLNREIPSGCAAFDAAYQVFASPGQTKQPPVDVALAARVLHWPATAIAPHSMLAWRDFFGLQLQARLPGPPNWETVSYFLAWAEDFAARLPPPVMSTAQPTLVDRLATRWLRS